MACLECISGNTTGEMLDYMTFGSTLILYGTLSEQPAGGINTIGFIGKNQKIEPFLLNVALMKLDKQGYQKLVEDAHQMYKSELKT